MRLRDISVENRPRERLISQGVTVLSDAEILALILGSGTKNENAVDLSNRLLSHFDLLSTSSLSELQKLKGIGVARACQLLALFEFSKRFNSSKVIGKKISCSKDVYDFVKSKMVDLDKEHFVVLLLDSKNRVLKEVLVSIGILNSSLVHPREVFKQAIKESANSIILVHNHPSGDVTPSKEDYEVTTKLREVGELMGIRVLDHVIVGSEGYYSFNE